jgi:sialate O-acetylesterase
MLRVVSAAAAALVLLGAPAAAQDRPLLSPMFADHAVLQRDRAIPVWGWAAPGETVIVNLAGQEVRVRADRSGAWRAQLPTRATGGPYELSARTSRRRQTIADVMVGDVYLCSGQSNMEFAASAATNGRAALQSSMDDGLRLFAVTRRIASTPQAAFEAPDRWAVASPESVEQFSAVCYFFGRNLRQTQHVPIGLIAASWGGTPIESWISDASFRRLGGYNEALARAAQAQRDPAAAQAAYEETLRVWWRSVDPGERAGYANADLDASQWETINPSGFWENAGVRALEGFDGIVWYRAEFTLTEQQAAQAAQMLLGPADDVDRTFINGTPIGVTHGWDTPRAYAVPAGVLRAGRNVFASAVLDTGGGGGWWGPADEKLVRFADGTSAPIAAWRYRIAADLADIPAPPRPPSSGANTFSALYNGMIAPVAPYALSGALWYQGEANASAAGEYARLLPAMMGDWRRTFATPDLPFFIVQLSSYGAPSAGAPREGWGALRDVQRRVAAADARAGLAATIDIGDRYDIHPSQKQIVGERLARIARRMIYGEAIADSGPSPISAWRAGEDVVVRFTHGPLLAYSSNRPMAFEVCDAARVCRFVDASITGDDVRLDARGAAAAFVRYCWGDGVICNLFNDADLPAPAFELEIR